MFTPLKFILKPQILLGIILVVGGIFIGYKVFFPEKTEAVIVVEEKPAHISFVLGKLESKTSLNVASVKIDDYKYQEDSWKGKAFYLLTDAEVFFEYSLKNVTEEAILEEEDYFLITLNENDIKNDAEFVTGENNIRGWGNLLTSPESTKELYTKAETALEEQVMQDKELMNEVKSKTSEAFVDFLSTVTDKRIIIEFSSETDESK